MPGQTDGQTLFYRTLLAIAGDPKILISEHVNRTNNMKTKLGLLTNVSILITSLIKQQSSTINLVFLKIYNFITAR